MFDFDPQYSTPQIKTVERFIQMHYPFDDPVSCRLIQRGLNDVYLVNPGQAERHVFRLSHHRARGPADVVTETAFLMHLSRAGVPVAAPIPTRDSSLFVTGYAPEGEREGVLFQAVAGRDPGANDAGDARANGRTLALMHDAAETFASNGALYRLDLEHLLHRPLARIRDSDIVEAPAVLDEFEAIADRTTRAIEAFGDLSWTHCHGDCHGFNSRIDDRGQAVFFDFDDSGPGYLAYDLSVFLWAKRSFGRQQSALWDAFVGGYRAVRPIKPDDFEAALHFVIVRHIWLMGEYASRTQEWGSNAVDWIAKEADFLRQWESEQLTGRLF